MQMKFKNIDDKYRYDRKAQKIMFFTSAIMIIIPFFLFVLQAVRGIISAWNLIPTILAIGIGVNAFRMSFGKKKKDQGLYYSENVESEEDRLAREDEEKFAGALLDVFTPLSVKSKVLRFLASVLIVGVGCVMFAFAPVKTNLISVNATVVSQVDKTTYEYSKDSDGDTTVTEHRACQAVVSFTFKGEKKTETIYLEGVSFIYSENVDIYVDSTGKFVESVASSQTLYWVGGIFVLTGILLLISLYFSISNVVFVPVVMMLLGGSLAFVLGLKVSFVDMLVSDMTTFFSLFVSIALYMFVSFFLIAAQFPRNITDFVTWEKYRPRRSPRMDQYYAHRNRPNGSSYQVSNPYIHNSNRNMYENETQRNLKEGEQVVVGRVDENPQNQTNDNTNFDNNGSNF